MRYLVRSTLAAVVALALVTSHAQAQMGAELGVRGGVSVASASWDADATFDKSNQTGFVGGAFLNYDMGILGLQIAGQYAQKGFGGTDGTESGEASLDYLEFPAVVKAGIPLGIFKPSVLAGAAMSFALSCDVNGVDCKDEIKSTDFYGIAGADVAIYLGSISLWVDGRYNFSFSDINDGEFIDNLKNKAWTFQAGVAFGLGGS
jgi:hypothetical protein